MTQVRSSTSRRPRRQVLEVLMDRLVLGAVVLRRPANFAWYTGGADNRVDHASQLGVAERSATPLWGQTSRSRAPWKYPMG
jgi:hypothetical protein